MEKLERVKSFLDEKVYKHLLNGNFYKVSRVEPSTKMAVLNAIDGKSQVITELSNLRLFYETVDYRDGN